MFKRFLFLEWKAFFRSASFGKSLGLKILLIFLAIYFSLSFLFLGFGLYPIIEKFYPDVSPPEFVNRFVLIWLVLELGFRFMLQSLPIIDIKPLIILPINRRKVVNFVLLKSLYSFYNILSLLWIIPFGIFSIYKGHSTVGMLGWILAMVFLSLCVNFLNFIIKKKFTENLKALLPVILVIIIFGLLEYFKVFEISPRFGVLMNFLFDFPYLAVFPFLGVITLYKWNQYNLENKFYLDTALKGKKQSTNTHNFGWTQKFGSIAPFLQLDLKLIWRNKRPKTTIYMSFLLLLYGLIFYTNDSYADFHAMFVFAGIFMTGIFMINFGQFIPAWDASYYPLMMSQNIPMKQYLQSKAGLITFSVVVLTILTTPYLYFGWHIFLINLVCGLYNIGVNVPVLLFAGAYNKKRIDLDKSPFMNYQGTGATQWLMVFPLMGIPILVFWLLNTFLSFEVALNTLAVLGVLGLLLRNILMEKICRLYKKRKYQMLTGFKQTGE